ncbi:ribosomal RNA small subunit methyltransferase A [Patescibacteria group bacterium]|nr:ribosomal RNA small subunit methyltransferase A [Patescibacteria group bacterium]
MTPSEIKAALAQLGGYANKRLGQHFLIDKNVLKTIVDTADIKRGDRVLEIGPGLGVLTRALVERGAEVIAIEQDRRFVEFLDSRLRENDIHVVQGDAAAVHWHELVDGGSWKFVSNLPYSITSLALRKALWAPRPPDKIVVLVQREVAERAIAKTGKTSLLSLMVALSSSSARIVKRVARGAFYPPPKVESAILEIIPMTWPEREKQWGIHPDKIMEVAKKGFAHPRKFLKSNLVLGPTSCVLGRVGIDEKARAEDLSPEEWARLALEMADQE